MYSFDSTFIDQDDVSFRSRRRGSSEARSDFRSPVESSESRSERGIGLQKPDNLLWAPALGRVARGVLLALFCLVPLAGAADLGQGSGNSGTIQGTVLDPSGAALIGAKVEIRNPVSGYDATAITDDSGRFQLSNIPYNPYHLVVSAPGFEELDQDVEIRSPLPIDLKLALQIATSTQTVTVQGEAGDLLEQTPTFHTDIDRKLFDKLPLESS